MSLARARQASTPTGSRAAALRRVEDEGAPHPKRLAGQRAGYEDRLAELRAAWTGSACSTHAAWHHRGGVRHAGVAALWAEQINAADRLRAVGVAWLRAPGVGGAGVAVDIDQHAARCTCGSGRTAVAWAKASTSAVRLLGGRAAWWWGQAFRVAASIVLVWVPVPMPMPMT